MRKYLKVRGNKLISQGSRQQKLTLEKGAWVVNEAIVQRRPEYVSNHSYHV